MHCIANNSSGITNDESKSTIYTTCLTRGTSALLCDVQCTGIVTLFRAKYSYNDLLYATVLNNICISSEKRTVHLLMMTDSKPHTQVATR